MPILSCTHRRRQSAWAHERGWVKKSRRKQKGRIQPETDLSEQYSVLRETPTTKKISYTYTINWQHASPQQPGLDQSQCAKDQWQASHAAGETDSKPPQLDPPTCLKEVKTLSHRGGKTQNCPLVPITTERMKQTTANKTWRTSWPTPRSAFATMILMMSSESED